MTLRLVKPKTDQTKQAVYQVAPKLTREELTEVLVESARSLDRLNWCIEQMVKGMQHAEPRGVIQGRHGEKIAESYRAWREYQRLVGRGNTVELWVDEFKDKKK